MTDHTPAEQPLDPTLVAAWNEATAVELDHSTPFANPVEFASSIAEAHRKDTRRLLWLNVQEVVPALAIGAIFGLQAANAARPWAAVVAAAIVVGVGVFLAVSSVRHQRAAHRWSASVRDQLARRLEQVRHRARLYRMVIWWYLLPIAVAIVLYRFGRDGELRLERGDVIYYGVCVVFFAGLYRMNRQLGRKRYEPEVTRLEALLVEFDRVT